MNLKILFTGPESTGKTSLATAVSEKYSVSLFPEYAREYLLNQGGKYTYEDLEKIALEQHKIRIEKEKRGFQIYDTANEVLYVWSEYKYGKCAPSILELLRQQQFDCYFLCSPKDVPWEEDPLRENPLQREELFYIYQELLTKMEVNFVILEGNLEQRIKLVAKTLEALKNKKKRLSL